MKMMLLAILPNWNSLDSVRQAHSDFELAGLVFFALLVLAEALAHNSMEEKRKHLFDSIGIWFFAIAVLCEIAGYWYGQRNDFLAGQVIVSLDAKAKSALEKSEKADEKSEDALTKSDKAKTDAGDALTKSQAAQRELAHAESDSAKAQTVASNALTIASAASHEAKSFEADIVLAKKLAAEAESHLADAKRDAASAERDAIAANKELLKLKTPRSLSTEQQTRIQSKIIQFTRTPFDLWVSSDKESTDLMWKIKAVLDSSGWLFKKNEGLFTFDEGTAGLISDSGVSVHVPLEHEVEWRDAVLALCNALSAEGIPTKPWADSTEANKAMKRDRIHVEIGSKELD